jgi:hypothetical protein
MPVIVAAKENGEKDAVMPAIIKILFNRRINSPLDRNAVGRLSFARSLASLTQPCQSEVGASMVICLILIEPDLLQDSVAAWHSAVPPALPLWYLTRV